MIVYRDNRRRVDVNGEPEYFPWMYQRRVENASGNSERVIPNNPMLCR